MALPTHSSEREMLYITSLARLLCVVLLLYNREQMGKTKGAEFSIWYHSVFLGAAL